jgi:hypothetical protein
MTEPTKRCTKCGNDRPVSLFTKKTSSKDGLNSWCKPCWYGIELEPEMEPVVETMPEPVVPVALQILPRKEQIDQAAQLIVAHLKEHGETVDEFFKHRISYDHTEVTREAVKRAINNLLKEAKVKVTRWETSDDLERLNFLALA